MSDGGNNVTIKISTGAIMKVILFSLLFVLIFYLRDLVLILLTAIVIASAIEPATKWFMRYKIPRVPAVLFVYTAVVAFVFGIFYLFIPAILNDASGFFSDLPGYLNSINFLIVLFLANYVKRNILNYLLNFARNVKKT